MNTPRGFLVTASLVFATAAAWIGGSSGEETNIRLAQAQNSRGASPDAQPPVQPKSKVLPSDSSKASSLSLLSENELGKWRQCGPGKFTVAKGVATGEGGMGLWWYTERQFTNFVLRGEFVQEQPIADSGVFLRFPDPKEDPWNAVNQGHEMEIGDPNPKDPTWRTGSIYPFQASTNANTLPAGNWNQYEITCIGQTYSVRMNGQLILTWTDPKERTRF